MSQKRRQQAAEAAVITIGACSFSRLVRLHGRRRVHKYLAFLALKAVEEDFDATLLLPPSQSVTVVWHDHILDTKHYRETCNALCGEVFEHDPEDKVMKASGERDRRRQYTARLSKDLEPVLKAIKVSVLPPPAAPPPLDPAAEVPVAPAAGALVGHEALRRAPLQHGPDDGDDTEPDDYEPDDNEPEPPPQAEPLQAELPSAEPPPASPPQLPPPVI